jgi:hypothetical protein
LVRLLGEATNMMSEGTYHPKWQSSHQAGPGLDGEGCPGIPGGCRRGGTRQGVHGRACKGQGLQRRTRSRGPSKCPGQGQRQQRPLPESSPPRRRVRTEAGRCCSRETRRIVGRHSCEDPGSRLRWRGPEVVRLAQGFDHQVIQKSSDNYIPGRQL